MPDYYSITLRASFGVLADSQEEAEEIARLMLPDFDEYPASAMVSVGAYLTPNQSDDIKRYAENR